MTEVERLRDLRGLRAENKRLQGWRGIGEERKAGESDPFFGRRDDWFTDRTPAPLDGGRGGNTKIHACKPGQKREELPRRVVDGGARRVALRQPHRSSVE
jgi:hypothetical protein